MEPEFNAPSWSDELDCAVTLCDTEGVVLYQNERSRAIIARLIAEGGRNVYTIEKRGVHKLIYQTAWRRKGVIGGLVEFSLELPDKMPHYVRS